MNPKNLIFSFNGKAIDFTDGIREIDEEGRKDGVYRVVNNIIPGG
jgi:hypothetical protein